jgi:hypothetical protein
MTEPLVGKMMCAQEKTITERPSGIGGDRLFAARPNRPTKCIRRMVERSSVGQEAAPVRQPAAKTATTKVRRVA